MGLLSSSIVMLKTLKTGLTYEDLQNTLEQKDYKNEKQKNSIQKDVISAFAAADANNDNVLSKDEIAKYYVKGAFVGAGIAACSLAVGCGVGKMLGKYLGEKLAKIVTPVIRDMDFGHIASDAMKNVGSNVSKLA